MVFETLDGSPIQMISRPGPCAHRHGGLWGNQCLNMTSGVVIGPLGQLRLCCIGCMSESVRLGNEEVTDEMMAIIEVLNS